MNCVFVILFQQIKSEVLFTSFLVEHNMPLSAADHAGALNRCSLTRILLPNLAVQGNWELVISNKGEALSLPTSPGGNVFGDVDNLFFLVAGGAL